MERVLLKQPKLVKVKILGVILFALSFYMFFVENVTIVQFIMLLLSGVILLAYSITFEINKGFNNNKYFELFGIKLFKQKITLPYPDYISVFPAVLKQDNEWNTISALGTSTKSDTTLIKFFYKNKNVTVFRTNSPKIALKKASDLGEMLTVKVLDKTSK